MWNFLLKLSSPQPNYTIFFSIFLSSILPSIFCWCSYFTAFLQVIIDEHSKQTTLGKTCLLSTENVSKLKLYTYVWIKYIFLLKISLLKTEIVLQAFLITIKSAVGYYNSLKRHKPINLLKSEIFKKWSNLIAHRTRGKQMRQKMHHKKNNIWQFLWWKRKEIFVSRSR